MKKLTTMLALTVLAFTLPACAGKAVKVTTVYAKCTDSSPAPAPACAKKYTVTTVYAKAVECEKRVEVVRPVVYAVEQPVVYEQQTVYTRPVSVYQSQPLGFSAVASAAVIVNTSGGGYYPAYSYIPDSYNERYFYHETKQNYSSIGRLKGPSLYGRSGGSHGYQSYGSPRQHVGQLFGQPQRR